ncbi:MAG: flavodoxin domain-containing protein [Candidatus Saccharicenans sp.]|nr:flavodoxin domain-containing protein [Candidatus Saccharicenans sp.]
MSRYLIAYATKYGTTARAVDLIRNNLAGAITCNLKKEHCPDLENFDWVIIGGSIYAGRVQKEVKKFCQKNRNLLLQKKVGLFICCMYDGQKAEEQFNEAFPQELRQAARAKAIFGGELSFEKMNFLEKFIIKKFIGVKESFSRFRPDEISEFSRKLSD